MKKNKIVLIFLVIIVGITIGAFYCFYTQNINNGEQNNYEATRTSTNDNADINTNNDSNNNVATETNNNGNTTNNIINEEPSPPTETMLSTFSTKIYTKESARQNNINITCSSLNNTIVKAGETFSFCGTVGQATTAKGYQKADIFDKTGNKKKGLRWWKLSSK